jgi:peptidyl-dipeptidase Dcp
MNSRSATVLALVLAACAGQETRPEPAPAAAPAPKPAPAPVAPSPSASATDPLLAPWQGPWDGVPPFGKFKVADIQKAMEDGMAQNLAEIDQLAANPEAPGYENTIAALERVGQPFNRVSSVYNIYTSTMNDEGMQKVQSVLSPKLSEFNDKVVQNPKLFARIAAVYEKRDSLKLTPEQQRLLWLDYTGFVRQGARLSDADKKQLSDLNQQLAAISTKFSQNLLAEEGTQLVLIEKESELAGLSPALIEQAAQAAGAHGQPGKWAITNTRSSTDPFLTFAKNRALREKVWRMFVMRGDNGDEHDNNALVSQVLELRLKKAKLLGYQTYAHWKLEDQMAKTPEHAIELMEAVWKPAVARVHEEVADMQKLADKEKGRHFKIAPWDYRYYAEKVRKARYDLDENDTKPYLQLEKLREGMFFVAGQLFGFKFVPITDGSVPVYQEDVRVWQVQNAEGKHVGLWYFDPYARPGKNSGAWMNEYRPQQHLQEVPVIVSNNANFVKGKPGAPVLISWDDATTLFHEFGHALHGLNSNVTYPQLAGTNVARDYVEFPSQLLEHWLSTPEVLNTYALHYQTGKPIPAALVKKIEKAKAFNQGFITVEYLSSALVDMKLHLAEPTKDARKFEKDTLAALGMPSELVMRHRTAQFHHIMADGYEAGYYAYLWADTLSADAYEAFVEASGPYDKAVAKRLHDHVFSTGNTIDPADGYRAFRGRDPGTGALMRKRGFAPPEAHAARP